MNEFKHKIYYIQLAFSHNQFLLMHKYTITCLLGIYLQQWKEMIVAIIHIIHRCIFSINIVILIINVLFCNVSTGTESVCTKIWKLRKNVAPHKQPYTSIYGIVPGNHVWLLWGAEIRLCTIVDSSSHIDDIIRFHLFKEVLSIFSTSGAWGCSFRNQGSSKHGIDL